jgi:hypothetical protein
LDFLEFRGGELGDWRRACDNDPFKHPNAHAAHKLHHPTSPSSPY